MSYGSQSDNHSGVNIAGLVLAGGEGRRMGGDKPFREIAGRSLISLAIETVRRQCGHVMISSNQSPDTFAGFDIPVVADVPVPGQGPLGGILGGLTVMSDAVDWLVTFPVDCPVVPDDMAQELIAAAREAGSKAAFVRHGERDHYLSSAWHRDCAPVIAELLSNEQYRVRGPLMAVDAIAVPFAIDPDQPALFANVNTGDDLASLAMMLNKDDLAGR
ncbi:molybdenum cofactor guanylyltransferase [Thalassospira sp. CH_XMU1448-2]|uniref:molybdenum cofactor guanylyltransferase n=1 Tax=Thalassospira sp. CH_XMU1448-2 TaxID=3107773 RepID=UPI0030085125